MVSANESDKVLLIRVDCLFQYVESHMLFPEEKRRDLFA